MCVSTSTPSIPAPPPPAPEPVTEKNVSEATSNARSDQKKKAKQAAGRSSTVLTGALGIQDEARTAGKTVLGA